MKVGVRLKINVKDIMKAWLFPGTKGTYLDATVFIDIDNADQYGNNGMITQDVPQKVDEKQGPILGNCKVFWRDDAQTAPQANTQAPAGDYNPEDDDDIPF